MEDTESAGAWKSFEKEWTERIVATVNWLRENRGFTIREMADRLNYFGWPVSVATLSGILSGHKRGSFTIGEVFCFARVLNVSPTYLVLGLPFEGAMPDGKLFGSKFDVTAAASWISGRTVVEPHPADDISRDNQQPEYFVEAMARQGLQDVVAHENTLSVIRWQAALLVATDSFSKDDVARALPPAVLNQEWLWDAINSLSQVRRNQISLGERGIPFPDIPEWLRFIDAEGVLEVEDPTKSELESITTPDLIWQAKESIRQTLKRSQDGSFDDARRRGVQTGEVPLG